MADVLWSYIPGSTADRDRVRLAIGDTDVTRQRFADLELDDFLAKEGSVPGAGAAAVEALWARLAIEYDFTADGASFARSQQAKALSLLAQNLRRKANAADDTTQHVIRIDGYSTTVRSDEVSENQNATFDRSGLVP